MHRLDIYICTKSKCTAKKATLKLRTDEVEAGSYNGPALLAAIRELVVQKNLGERVAVHEAACMSGCPVGPRVDIMIGSRRVMYFQRKTPTGREDLISWGCIDSVESVIAQHLLETPPS
jgi:predicted metal-binding protein